MNMKNTFITKKIKSKDKTPNIFANSSSLLINSILLENTEDLSINQIAKLSGISVGLAHKVISQLLEEGIVCSQGVRTAKQYEVKKPKELLKKWISYYNITEKCKFRTYNVGISKNEIIKKIKNSKLKESVAYALHSACSNNNFTNLDKCEFYLLEKELREDLEKLLKLEPVDRGYQVLLIEPYYSKMLDTQKEIEPKSKIYTSPPLLTFLDLYHFPLRGLEQAEHLLRTNSDLRKISALYFSK